EPNQRSRDAAVVRPRLNALSRSDFHFGDSSVQVDFDNTGIGVLVDRDGKFEVVCPAGWLRGLGSRSTRRERSQERQRQAEDDRADALRHQGRSLVNMYL